ncbi:hypothetical protein CBR_g5739 [Chara braunii]|uniref:Uncharacterized protein n=1 Tax=Chara braunii TaxID=69332 RepID=A0A388KJC9_CHABU|nr:hypothetical protein CBR_g5739 [Chara braunii]|eukprot:GBG70108.1 hypothetical protein CBR_g5739 [Chara braunii]
MSCSCSLTRSRKSPRGGSLSASSSDSDGMSSSSSCKISILRGWRGGAGCGSQAVFVRLPRGQPQLSGGSPLCGVVALPSPDARIAAVAASVVAGCVLVGSKAVVATADAGSVRSAVGTAPFVDVVGGGTAPAVLVGGSGVGPRIAPAAVPVPAPECACFAEVTPAGFVGFVAAASPQLVVAVGGVGSMSGVASVVVAGDAASPGPEHGIVVSQHVVVVAAFAAARAAAARFVGATSVVAQHAVVVAAFAVVAAGAAHFVDAAAVVAAAFVPVVPTVGADVTSLAGPVVVGPAAVTCASAPIVVQVDVIAFDRAAACGGAVVRSTAAPAVVARPQVGDRVAPLAVVAVAFGAPANAARAVAVAPAAVVEASAGRLPLFHSVRAPAFVTASARAVVLGAVGGGNNFASPVTCEITLVPWG